MNLLAFVKTPPALVHKTGAELSHEIQACIGCNECLLTCPAISEAIAIDQLNRETISGPISEATANFARSCYQCGACIEVCPIGLHRDLMMLELKRRLLYRASGE